jgi:DNA-binding IclR family transcriptional regulator
MTRGSSSLSKALGVLDSLARLDDGTHPVSVSEIVELTGLDKSQVSRMLSTFVDHGYVERIGQRKGYRLGWHSYLVGRRAQVSHLGEMLRPHVEQLGRSLEQSAYFSILSGTQGVTIASYEPDRRLYVNSWDGRPFPVIGSAVGEALLADSSDEQLAALHGDASALEGDLEWDLETLRERVSDARASGIAHIENEHAIGVSTLAMPVRIRGGVVGALSVTEPVPMLAPGRAATISARLRESVARLQADPRPVDALG